MVGVIAIPAVFLAVLALRLMAGPIDLDFLKSRFNQGFETPNGRMRVETDRIYVEWSSLRQPMRLVAHGLRLVDTQGKEVATAPSVALTFDARSVVQGYFLPRSIVVERPSLTADLEREGGMLRRILAESDSNSQGRVVDLLIEQLLAEPNHNSLLGQIDTVAVEQATVTLRDVPTGMTWVAPSGRASLKRDAAGVIIAADATFSNGGSPIEVALSGTYARDRSRISAEAKIDGLKPSMLADLSPDTAILRGVDIALSGRLAIDAEGNGRIRTVGIDVTGGAGTINLPGILPVAHKVHSVNAHAAIDADTHTARITNIDVDLGAVKLLITADGARTPEGQLLNGKAELRNIPLDRLGDYWPLDFTEGGRRWAMANLSNGTLDVAAEFGLKTPGNDLAQIAVTRTLAMLNFRGMTVHYMPHMPELVDVLGSARYENGTLHFDVTGGGAVGLRVSGGTIDLTGLTGAPPHRAAMRLPIAGPAAAVDALLLRPKLGIPKESLFDPKRLAGDAAVELSLAFPLIESLTVNDIDVKARATVTGFGLKKVLGDIDLTEATGQVNYEGSQLVITGNGKLDGYPVEIGGRELFGSKAAYRQRYEVKGTVPAVAMQKAGFPSPEPYVSGPVGLALAYQVNNNGSSEVTGKLDLKGAKVEVAALDWTKAAGVEGNLALALKLAPGGKLVSAEFDARASGLTTKGQLHFGGDNSIQQVTLQQLAIGRTEMSLDWKRAAGGVDLTVRGRSLEWPRVRHALKVRDEMVAKAPAGAAETSRTNTRFSFQLDQLLVQRGSLGSLRGVADMRGDNIASADIAISGGKGSAFRVTREGNRRKLGIYTPDLGLLLSEAGWLDGFAGSFFDFQGYYDDSTPASPLEGSLRLGPYKMKQVTPRPDIGTLNSTIEGLNRAGDATQQFNGLEATVVKTGDRVELKNARTSGQSIGLTAAGVLNTGNDTAHLRGVVVPAFALNNLLSNVPLLGPLLTGGKDGGVFAISYRLDGPFDDLKLNINMMSAVTPGALREIFNSSSPDGSPSQTPMQPPAQSPAP